nr:hypothetical protein [uncultured Campylobacter sp.]
MIKSIKFEGESIEELEVWYYAPKHECSAAEFARECSKLARGLWARLPLRDKI